MARFKEVVVAGVQVRVPLSEAEEAEADARDAAFAQKKLDEQAGFQRSNVDDAEMIECCSDPSIIALLNLDRAGWVAWAKSNFQTLNVAEQTRIGTLFWVVAVGVRRTVRNQSTQ